MSISLELLAPAGSPEAFAAAMEAGADAVYLGLPGFNARAKARNFTPSDLEFAVKEAHAAKRHVYLTLNTLIKDEELPRAVEELLQARSAGVDAVILQDLGIARILRRALPDMPLHASTQMGIHNAWGVQMLEHMGFERAILARECTLGELSDIRKRTKIGLEVFAHGALCFSVSGQCLFSSFLGGRSANRGRCTQPCRRAFSLGGRKMAPFSMLDLSLLPHLAALASAGVGTIKIEGRLRSAEYVYTVVNAYRRVLDATDNDRQEAIAVSMEELEDDHGRPKRDGYLKNPTGESLVDAARTHSAGVFVGKIESVAGGRAHLVSKRTLEIGDRIRILDRFEGERAAVTLKTLDSRPTNNGNVHVSFPAPKGMTPGDLVFRTATKKRKRFPLNFPNNKKAAGEKNYQKRAGEIVRELDDEIRRLFPSGRKGARVIRRVEFSDKVPPPQILGKIPFDDLIVPAMDPAVKRISGKARKQVILALPAMVFEADAGKVIRKVRELNKNGYRRFLVRNLGHFILLQDFNGVELYADASFGVLNSHFAATLLELGVKTVAVSLEADAKTVAALVSGGRGNSMEWVVHARPVLFTSRTKAPLPKNVSQLSAGKDGRFQVTLDSGGTRVIAERAMSAAGVVDKRLIKKLRATRIQLGASDLGGARLKVILENISRWKAVPGTSSFNLDRDGNLL